VIAATPIPIAVKFFSPSLILCISFLFAGCPKKETQLFSQRRTDAEAKLRSGSSPDKGSSSSESGDMVPGGGHRREREIEAHPPQRGNFDPTKVIFADPSSGVSRRDLFSAKKEIVHNAQGTLNWIPLGPAPLSDRYGSTYSGRVTSIAVHPTNPNIAYVGTAQGGLYRTLNGGNTWTPLLDDALTLAVGAVAIAPSDPSMVFVGTGESNHSADSFFGVGVYVVMNAESSPVLVGPLNRDLNGHDVLSGTSISQILVNPTDPNQIFLANTYGFGGLNGNQANTSWGFKLYRCSNALGASPTLSKVTVFAAQDNPGHYFAYLTDMVFEPNNPNHLICYVSDSDFGGIYRSTNALDPAPVFTRTLPLANQNVKLAINKVGSVVTVLAATDETRGGVQGALRISGDGGLTWSSPLAAADGYCNGQGWYDIGVAIDPTNANIFYIGGGTNFGGTNLSKSVDRGQTFAEIYYGAGFYLHTDTHAITVAPSNPSVVYFGSDGGIWKSVNAGAAWQSLNNATFNALQFESLALHRLNRNFTIGGTQDNGTEHQRPDGTWIQADGGDGGYSVIDQNAADTTSVTMYHTYYNAPSFMGFERASVVVNGIPQWEAFLGVSNGQSNNGIGVGENVAFYAPLVQGPGSPNTIYFGSDRLYRSVDRGTTMSVVSQAPLDPFDQSHGAQIKAIGISPQNDNVRIVGTQAGHVFSTTTGSSLLTDVTGPIPYYVARTVIDPNNATTAYVAVGGFDVGVGKHIWKTTNLAGGGSTWQSSGTGIPDVPVNALVVDPADSTHLYAGTDVGVYSSTDAGATWNPYGDGLPRVSVFDIGIQNPFRLLRIATHGRGMYEIPIGGTEWPVITSVLSATATKGQAFSYQIEATNSPTSYNASGLPTGLNVNTASGLISGTPTSTGNFNVGLSATNNGGTGTATLVLTVNPPVPVITSVLSATATKGQAFSYQIEATNSPTSYNASGLPTGLNVNTASGLISGTPTSTGNFNVGLSATNNDGTGTATLALTILNRFAQPDFNRDGEADYALFNSTIRQTRLFYLNNGALVGDVGGLSLPPGWQLVDAADFNADGYSDYVLFDPTTRGTQVWYMAGATHIGGFVGPTLPSGYTLLAARDFNHDGHCDYLLYHAGTRLTAIWYLNRNVIQSSRLSPMIPVGFSFAGAADFNGDGNIDFLLFHPSLHRSLIWYLTGVAATVSGTVLGPMIPNAYGLVGAADFNNDGKPDFVLYDPATRQTRIWLLHNNILVGGLIGPPLPIGFTLAAP
jgi:photosystem II stability/assembly factor-like uncharacterized protein